MKGCMDAKDKYDKNGAYAQAFYVNFEMNKKGDVTGWDLEDYSTPLQWWVYYIYQVSEGWG
jgi:hypothetical protein